MTADEPRSTRNNDLMHCSNRFPIFYAIVTYRTRRLRHIHDRPQCNLLLSSKNPSRSSIEVIRSSPSEYPSISHIAIRPIAVAVPYPRLNIPEGFLRSTETIPAAHSGNGIKSFFTNGLASSTICFWRRRFSSAIPKKVCRPGSNQNAFDSLSMVQRWLNKPRISSTSCSVLQLVAAIIIDRFRWSGFRYGLVAGRPIHFTRAHHDKMGAAATANSVGDLAVEIQFRLSYGFEPIARVVGHVHDCVINTEIDIFDLMMGNSVQGKAIPRLSVDTALPKHAGSPDKQGRSFDWPDRSFL